MMTRGKMVSTTLDGLTKANAEYRKWSEDWVSDNPVEGLVVAHVARAFFERGRANSDKAGVTLEEKFGYLRDVALPENAKRGKPYKGFAKNRRVDVVYWIADNPKVAIEVKRGGGWEGIERDLVRMRGLLAEAGPRHGGSLSACIVSHYLVGKWREDGTTKVERLIDRRRAKFSEFLQENRSKNLLLDIGANGSGSQFKASRIRKITEKGSHRRTHAFFEVGCCYLLAPSDTMG